MMKEKPGPKPGSPGAARIAEAHKGSKPHDSRGGFAADPERARAAGRKGGETLKERRGLAHFSEIGKKGGNQLKEVHGTAHFSKIGTKGGRNNAKRLSERPTDV